MVQSSFLLYIITNGFFTPITVNRSWQCEIKVHFCCTKHTPMVFVSCGGSVELLQIATLYPILDFFLAQLTQLQCFLHTAICKLKLVMWNKSSFLFVPNILLQFLLVVYGSVILLQTTTIYPCKEYLLVQSTQL